MLEIQFLRVIAYHRNVDSSRVDNNDNERAPLIYLGVNTAINFGSLKSDLIAQLLLPNWGQILEITPSLTEWFLIFHIFQQEMEIRKL